jgi:hypothetical protein
VVRISTRTSQSASVDDPGRRLQPVQLRHPDVHQDHVRPVRPHRRDGLKPVPGLGHDLDVVLVVEHHAEPAPDQRLIVDDHDADAHLVRAEREAGDDAEAAVRMAVRRRDFRPAGGPARAYRRCRAGSRQRARTVARRRAPR